jgi:hypothetical protein
MNVLWFDVDSMIARLRPQINQTQGRRFTAFSTSNGYVYVQPKLIENIAKEQAEKAGVLDVVSMGGGGFRGEGDSPNATAINTGGDGKNDKRQLQLSSGETYNYRGDLQYPAILYYGGGGAGYPW